MSKVFEVGSLVGFAMAGFAGFIALSAFGRLWPEFFPSVAILFLLVLAASIIMAVILMGIAAGKLAAKGGVKHWTQLAPATTPAILAGSFVFLTFFLGVWVGR